MLTFELDTLVPETERSMVNIQLTLALSIWRGRVNGHLDGSIQNLTDAQLFKAYRDLIERGRGDNVFSARLKADGEEWLAWNVRRGQPAGRREHSWYAKPDSTERSVSYHKV